MAHKNDSELFRTFTIINAGLFVFYSIFWVAINSLGLKETMWANYFTDSYGIIAGVGGIAGLFVSRRWGGITSLLGKSLFLFSIGLLFNFLGQVSYAIYFYVYNIENPYPSFGEVFYFGSVFIYIYAVWLFGKVSGTQISLKALRNRVIVFILPIFMMIASYLFFLRDYQIDASTPIITFLDFGYPLGEAILVSLSVLAYFLSRNVLGGMMRNRVLFFIGALIVQYIADSVFLYRTFEGIWYAAGLSDYIFVVAYFLMALALIKFGNAYYEVSKKTKERFEG
jgi:hypothetical protein